MNAPVQTIMPLESLPEREQYRREELETVVADNLQAFLAVGRALREINDMRLYRSTHLTFRDYVLELFDMGRSHAGRLIDAAVVVEQIEMSPMGDISTLSSERQIRPLAKYKNNPDELLRIWETAVETAPGGKVTEKHVQRTIHEITGEKVKKTIKAAREPVRRDGVMTEGFKLAFDQILYHLEEAKKGGYEATSRQAIIKHLEALTEAIAADGDIHLRIKPVQRQQTDLDKLHGEGFRIFRADESGLVIEEQESEVSWIVFQSFDDEKVMSARFEKLMENPKYLRG